MGPAAPGRTDHFLSTFRSCGYRACRTGTPLSTRVWAARYSEVMARDKVDVVKRVVEASNRRDVDGAFAELVTPDFEWHPAIVRALDGAVYRGREGVERFAADTSENWEELQNVAAEFRDLGGRVFVLGRPGSVKEVPRPPP